MKKLLKMRGFTLVELLIVIAVIGILAVAVLAALDPVEQLKKSRDTGRLSDSREMYNAMTRYYASYNCYPDERDYGTADGDAATNCTAADFPLVSMGIETADEFTNTLADLTQSGELKDAFSNKQTVTRGQLFATHDDQGATSVCFHPESRSGRQGGIGPLFEADLSPNGACVTTAAYDADNPAVADAVDCMVCVQ